MVLVREGSAGLKVVRQESRKRALSRRRKPRGEAPYGRPRILSVRLGLVGVRPPADAEEDDHEDQRVFGHEPENLMQNIQHFTPPEYQPSPWRLRCPIIVSVPPYQPSCPCSTPQLTYNTKWERCRCGKNLKRRPRHALLILSHNHNRGRIRGPSGRSDRRDSDGREWAGG